MLQLVLPCAPRLGKHIQRRFDELGQQLNAEQLLHREGLVNLVQDIKAQHREAVDAAFLFQRVENILAGALRLSHGRRRGKLRHMAENPVKVVGKFFVVGIVQRLGGVVTGGLPRRVAHGLLYEGKDPLPELGVLVVAADLLELPGHDAAKRAADGTAQIQLKDHRHVDQGPVPRAKLRPAAVELPCTPSAERRMLRNAVFPAHAVAFLNLFPDKAPVAARGPRRILRRSVVVFLCDFIDAEDFHRKDVDMEPVGGQSLLRRGQKFFPEARLHRPKLQRPLRLRHLADVFRVVASGTDYMLGFHIAHIHTPILTFLVFMSTASARYS